MRSDNMIAFTGMVLLRTLPCCMTLKRNNFPKNNIKNFPVSQSISTDGSRYALPRTAFLHTMTPRICNALICLQLFSLALTRTNGVLVMVRHVAERERTALITTLNICGSKTRYNVWWEEEKWPLNPFHLIL